jgi:Xaa-Pro aminopeptidase
VRRPEALRAALDGRTIIVSDPTNIRWLTGFGGSLGWVVAGPERITLVTDGRYAERAAADLGDAGLDSTVDVEIRVKRPEILDAVVALAQRPGRGAVLAEDHHLTHSAWSGVAARLELAAAGELVTRLRRVKDAGERARIAAAAAIADAALTDVYPLLAEQPTEADVRDELEYRMRRGGADGPSYDTIVASGPTFAARPHHETGRRTIVDGDTVVVDVGALLDGYHSDMTRTFVVGEPTTRQREIYDLVREAQAAGLATVREGVAAAEVDASARAVFEQAGMADWYLHSTGHGVGLLIHEDPFAAPGSTAVLMAGDVVTVEPGLYRDGFGGVRIEDLVTVTPTGCELFTTLPKDAPCLPSPPTT